MKESVIDAIYRLVWEYRIGEPMTHAEKVHKHKMKRLEHRRELFRIKRQGNKKLNRLGQGHRTCPKK